MKNIENGFHELFRDQEKKIFKAVVIEWMNKRKKRSIKLGKLPENIEYSYNRSKLPKRKIVSTT